MISIDFTRNRAQPTRDVQVSLALAPTTWVWPEKTVVQWDNDIAALDQLIADESAKHTQWRNAAELWQAALDRIQEITRDVARAGGYHFRNDPVKRLLFQSLSTDARDRAGVYEQALAARDAWQEADPVWALSPTDTVSGFSSMLTDCLAKQAAHSAKFTAWRRVSAALTTKARLVDEDCIRGSPRRHGSSQKAQPKGT